MHKFKQKGFTMIELLVVISIIGLLASIVLVSFPGAMKSARDARRKSDISQIKTALEVYYEVHGVYPLSGGAMYPNSGWDNTNDWSWTDFEDDVFASKRDWLSNLLAMVVAPPQYRARDPLNSATGWAGTGAYVYNYYSRSANPNCNQQWYMLVYNVENKHDLELLNSPGANACDGGNYNYGGTITTGKCRTCTN